MKVLVLLFILLFGLLENDSFPVRHLRHVSQKRILLFLIREPRGNFNPFIDDDYSTTVGTILDFDNYDKTISTVDEETLSNVDDKEKSDNNQDSTLQDHFSEVSTTSDLENLAKKGDEYFDHSADSRNDFPNDDEDLQDFGSGHYTTTKTFVTTAVLPPVDLDIDGSGSGLDSLVNVQINPSFNDLDFKGFETSGSGSGETNIIDDSELISGSGQVDIIFYDDDDDDDELSSSGSGSDQSNIMPQLFEEENLNDDDFTFFEESHEETGLSTNEETTNFVIDLLDQFSFGVEITTENSEDSTTNSKIDAAAIATEQDLEYSSIEDIEIKTTNLVALHTEKVQKDKEGVELKEEMKHDYEKNSKIYKDYVQEDKEAVEQEENYETMNEIYKYRLDVDDKIQKVLNSPLHHTNLQFQGIDNDYYIIIDDMADDDLDNAGFVDMESNTEEIIEKE